MSRSEDPNDHSKMDGSPKNIKAETARTRARGERKPPKKITETYLHNSGLYYLQRFAASAGQFRTVMQRKIDRSCQHHPDQRREDCIALLDALIAKFENIGLLNDEGYARGMVITLRRRGLSERAILMKLQNRGLPESRIKEALAAYNDENRTDSAKSDFRAALRLAQKKKVGPYASGEFVYDKALSAFARAGFPFDIARRVLDMRAEELNDDPAE